MQLQRGFVSAVIVIAIVLGFIVVGGGAYFVVHQQSSSQISGVAPPPNTQESTTVKTQNRGNNQVVPIANRETKVETQTPKKLAAKSGGIVVTTNSTAPRMSVKKISTGFVLNWFSVEKTLPLSVTTQTEATAPKNVSLCMSLVDANNVSVTETDCWPLNEYGNWSVMVSSDMNLAPDEKRMDFWTAGTHQAKVRFWLVPEKINDYSSDTTRTRHPAVAVDDTGIFQIYIPSGQNPN